MYRLRPWVGIVFTSSSLWKHRQHTAAEEEKEVGRSSSGHDRVIRKAEVAKHNSLATGVWVTHNDGVYDVTRFVANHPGGKEKLLLAAGASVDPFWRLYKQHLNSRLAEDILAPLRIGNLHPDDIASDLANMDSSDPYANDPPLSPLLRIHQNKPVHSSLLAHPLAFLFTPLSLPSSSDLHIKYYINTYIILIPLGECGDVNCASD